MENKYVKLSVFVLFLFCLSCGSMSPKVDSSRKLASTNSPFPTEFDLVSLVPMRNALAKSNKCDSVFVEADNFTGIIWIENGKILSSRYFWHKMIREMLSNTLADLDLNRIKIDGDVPEPNLYTNYKAAKSLDEVLKNTFNQWRAKDGGECFN